MVCWTCFTAIKTSVLNVWVIHTHGFKLTQHRITTCVEYLISNINELRGGSLMCDEIGEQYIFPHAHNYNITTLSHSHIHIYIQQFSVPRLQDTNLLIPSSDWSIKYLLELLWTFPFQLFFRFSFAALVSNFSVKLGEGK